MLRHFNEVVSKVKMLENQVIPNLFWGLIFNALRFWSKSSK